MSGRSKMVDDGDDNSKFGQRPLTVSGPSSGTVKEGQQVLPASDKPRAGQDTSKLILPEMPLPPELPADD